MSSLVDFGLKIKQQRTMLGMTQEELAKAIGYTSRSIINKIELGLVDVSQTKVMKLANALKVSPAFLLGIETTNSTNDDMKTTTPIQSAILTICSALTDKQQGEVLAFATKLLAFPNTTPKEKDD